MNAVVESTTVNTADQAQGATLVLPGQTPQGEYILSVLLKRTYDIIPGKRCVRAESDQPVIPGDVHWGNPMNSTVRFESDFVPFKLGTDVVLNGMAHAPRGIPATYCNVAIRIADRRKDIRVIGDRIAKFVKSGTPILSEPTPFKTMELRYERAYGGIDVYSDKKTSYPYPRNPLGCGFIVENTEDGFENLQIPNLEDPNDLLTPERLCIHEYPNWKGQPKPTGFGWFPKYYLPRAELAGIMPADRETEQELRKAYAALVPAEHRDTYLSNGIRDMDFHFFNGASSGLIMPYLTGDEEIATANLGPEGIVSFHLPGDMPEIGMDIGEGIMQTKVVIHTVMIHMEERQVDIVWRGAVPYKGPDWLVEMRKMETIIS